MASIPQGQEARRATRRRTDAPSTLRGQSTGPVDTFVHDVSATGARIQCDSRLALGDAVTIGLAGVGAVRAVVVWNRDGQYGLDFVTPLVPTEAEKAFAGETVISLTSQAKPVAETRAPETTNNDDAEDGVYAEASGFLSALLFAVAGVTCGAVAWMQGWI